MPRKWKSSELLEYLLDGHEPTPGQLDELIAQRIREDLHLDFKAGAWLADEKDAPRKLRAWVSSFANALGGVLIVGVRGEKDEHGDDFPVAVDGCPEGGASLADWARTALAKLAPFLHPPARHWAVAHPNGRVLVVAVARASQLVPCPEKGRLVHYLRHGDSTLPVDDYLHADLVLSRRAHPVLTLTAKHDHFGYESGTMKLKVSVHFRNNGLVWIRDGLYGLVGHTVGGGFHDVPTSMLQYLALVPEDERLQRVTMLMNSFALKELAPFDKSGSFNMHVTLPGNLGRNVRWKGVVFVLPRDSVPVFLQLDYLLDAHFQEGHLQAHPLQLTQIAPGVRGEVGLFLDVPERPPH